MAEAGVAGYHPSTDELERFLLGDLSPREAMPVITHLLRKCLLCQEKMAPTAAVLFTPGRKLPEPAPDSGAEYDFALFKAFAAVRGHSAAFPADQREMDAVLLKEVPGAEPLALPIRTQHDWARCEALFEKCRSLRDSDPEAMVLVGSLAVALAERIQPDEAGPQSLADLQARAWGELGNARRVADDYFGAERDLSRALEVSGHGTGSPLLLARLMDLTASLYTEQRRYSEASELLDRVYAIYRAHGETHAAGRALVSKAIAANHTLDGRDAILLHAQGLALIDAWREPKLVMASVHDLVIRLVDCGDFEQAAGLLKKSRQLYSLYGGLIDNLKASWLEGRIAVGLGEHEEAERLFREVQHGFLEIEKPCTAAVASLDLAALWLQRGLTTEIHELVDQTVAILRTHNIHREAIAALLMLREALQKEQATVALLQSVASEIQRLEREPARQSRA